MARRSLTLGSSWYGLVLGRRWAPRWSTRCSMPPCTGPLDPAVPDALATPLLRREDWRRANSLKCRSQRTRRIRKMAELPKRKNDISRICKTLFKCGPSGLFSSPYRPSSQPARASCPRGHFLSLKFFQAIKDHCGHNCKRFLASRLELCEQNIEFSH